MKKISISILILAMLSLIAVPLCVSAESTSVSKGTSYTLVTPASEGYPDDGKKLTDGNYGTHKEGVDGFYAGGDYVGFNKAQLDSNGNFVIIVDLGKVYDNLTEFTLGYLNETSVGITAPQSATFAVSDERNGEYQYLGKIETTPSNEELSATYAKSLTTQPVKGRFVRVEIKPQGYNDDNGVFIAVPWTFVDEVTVRANGTADTPTDDTPEGSTPTEDQTPDTPQTGDGTVMFAFIMLAISSFCMMYALFSYKKDKEF